MNKMKILNIALTALFFASYTEEAVAVSDETPVSASNTIPILHIDTEGNKPIVSKTEYIAATYWLDPLDNKDIEPLGSEAAPLAMEIRGRGHSSWKGDKKPYKIKLARKLAVMGMPKNKHFALLKPIEGTVAGLYLGKLMNMAWAPSFRPVEVVLNGDYIGLYFLTETIRIDENRVNIYKQKDQETDPELITGGWLVEIDNYRDECQITIPECSRWNLTLRYHSPEDLSAVQLQWLTNEFTAINTAIYSPDKTSTEWEKYIDVESMARFFILQEIMDNPDGFHGSFYLHKDLKDNAKWVAGPVWDLSCCNREKTDYTFRMEVGYSFTPHWIGEMIKYDSFCKAVEKVWNEVYPDRLSELYDYIDETMLPLESAWRKDCERWGGDLTAQYRASRIKNSLRGNIDWFNRHLPKSIYTSITERTADSDIATKVFNLQGICIGEYPNETEAYRSLKQGLYIINNKLKRK